MNSLWMDLSSYFVDDDGDQLTMIATYSKNGNSPESIPGGIFYSPTDFVIDVISSSIIDTGIYTINLEVSDTEPLTLSVSFTL
jgi:hypothetical protein